MSQFLCRNLYSSDKKWLWIWSDFVRFDFFKFSIFCATRQLFLRTRSHHHFPTPILNKFENFIFNFCLELHMCFCFFTSDPIKKNRYCFFCAELRAKQKHFKNVRGYCDNFLRNLVRKNSLNYCYLFIPVLYLLHFLYFKRHWNIFLYFDHFLKTEKDDLILSIKLPIFGLR